MVTALLIPIGTSAAFLGRDINGQAIPGNSPTAVFLYDPIQNVTWLRDAHASAGTIYDDGGILNDGRLTWASANAWANSLVVGSFGGWHLPDTTAVDPGCSFNLMLAVRLACRQWALAVPWISSVRCII